MKKNLFGAAMIFAVSTLTTTEVRADFKDAITEYQAEFGTTQYEGTELTLDWFRENKHPVDLNGDGVMDHYIIVDEFWIFGRCIWQSNRSREELIPGGH